MSPTIFHTPVELITYCVQFPSVDPPVEETVSLVEVVNSSFSGNVGSSAKTGAEHAKSAAAVKREFIGEKIIFFIVTIWSSRGVKYVKIFFVRILLAHLKISC